MGNSNRSTKTLDDVQADMSEIVEQLKADEIEIKKADAIVNATGKYLKAEQLKLAREVFETNRTVVLIGQKEVEAEMEPAE